MLSILLGDGNDAGDNYGAGGQYAGRSGATLLLDYNLVEGTGAALPHFRMRRGIQCNR